MPRTDFDALPDSARVWVFPLHDPISGEAAASVEARVEEFLEGWAAHGTPLTGAYRWVDGRFLVVAVDQASVPPSGCSIDSMVRILKEEEARLGHRLVDHSPVFYRDEVDGVKRLSRKEFREAAARGDVSPDTPVFDTTVTQMAVLRAQGIERPARDSWHGSVFF